MLGSGMEAVSGKKSYGVVFLLPPTVREAPAIPSIPHPPY